MEPDIPAYRCDLLRCRVFPDHLLDKKSPGRIQVGQEGGEEPREAAAVQAVLYRGGWILVFHENRGPAGSNPYLRVDEEEEAAGKALEDDDSFLQ
ncbi:hypothetical protein Nepgr_014931 [Nepenthes gracilis]|uniref:Uncharacterized protein n=1 Tax=Nepenthes gracilis TaxID=150966 RepID=A0AAD3SLX1_NEPGR|nr:hypothetical protein Nepgr_014931 [Nepenthes gracilis]